MFLRLVFATTFVFLVTASEEGYEEIRNRGARPYRPNILFILADDMGYQDVGFRGSDILTPNIDRLAKEGVVLENHYVMPQCSPTRASLLSGRHAIRNGFWYGNIKPTEEWGLRLDETTMAEMLKRNGYATHAIGKWHVGMHTWEHTPAKRGFDTFFGLYLGSQGYYTHKNAASRDFREDFYSENGTFVDTMRPDLDDVYSTGIFTDQAISVISKHDTKNPLFMYLSYTAPHSPYEAPKSDRDMYTGHMKKTSSERKNYATMISIMDRGIGEVVEALEQYGMRDNTLIVFSSDNGGYLKGPASNYPLRGGKKSLQEGGVRAVALVNSPLLQKTGYTNTNLHHVTDWYTTFQGLAGDMPEQAEKKQLKLDGHDIWDSISNNGETRDEILLNMRTASKLIKGPDPAYIDPANDPEKRELEFVTESKTGFFVIRKGDWKLFSGSYTVQDWSKFNYQGKKKKHGSEMGKGIKLYNLKDDPSEENNVAAKYPEVVKMIMGRYDEYEAEMTPVGRRGSSGMGKKGGNWYPWVDLM